MSSFPDDPMIDAAIHDLAGELESRLHSAVQEAATASLDRVVSELDNRAADVRKATSYVVDLMNSLAEEMRKHAGAALGDGVQSRIIPALEGQTRLLVDATEQRLNASFGQLQTLVSAAGASIQRAEAEFRAVAASNTNALTSSIDSSQRGLADAVKSSREVVLKRADDHLLQLRQELHKVDEATHDQLRKADAIASERMQALGARLGEVEARLAQAVSAAAKTHGQVQEQQAALIRSDLSDARELVAKSRTEFAALMEGQGQSIERRFGVLQDAVCKIAGEQTRFAKRSLWLHTLIGLGLIGVLTLLLMPHS